MPLSRRLLAALLCALAASAGVPAAASTLSVLPAVPGYVHEAFGLRDGTPPAGIVHALQTRDGHLWLATFDGLARFDGVRFERFDGARVPALASDRLVDLAEDRAGTLWIRSEQGHLVRYLHGEFQACGAPREEGACGLPRGGAPVFTFLGTDATGTVWTATGAALFEAGGSGLRAVPGFRPEGAVRSLFRDRSGQLWIGSDEALWFGRPGRFDRFPLPRAKALSSWPATVAQEGDGDLWIACGAGLGRLRAGRWQAELPPAFLVPDPRGRVWASLWFPGGVSRLARLEHGRAEVVAEEPAGDLRLIAGRQVAVGAGGDTWIAWAGLLLRDGTPVLTLPTRKSGMTSLLFDHEGTLWAATSRSGELHAFHPARVASFGAAEGLASASVATVFEDRNGEIWTGNSSGAFALAPASTRFRLAAQAPFAYQEMHSFVRDREGTLLVGTSKGIFRLDASGLQPLAPPAPPASFVVHALFEDSRGALWAGGEQGLWRRAPVEEGGSWSSYSARDGLPHPFVRVIREGSDGALWFGTNGGGVFRLAGGRFLAVTTAQGLASDLVRDLWPAPDGRLWIATENRGLNRLDLRTLDGPGRPRIDRVGGAQGLFADGIHKIVPDRFGGLWMSSNHGIFRVALRDLDAVADGRRARLESVAFTDRDGMASAEANGGSQEAGLRDRLGRIWFATQGGLVRIDPAAVVRRNAPPLLQVEGLLAGGRETPISGRGVRLPAEQRTFAFELAAPSFLAPERQRFRYRLFPYEREWVEAEGRRQAFYTQVPPGRYRFEALAAGSDGTWTERPVTVEVVVEPRFWETLPFRLVLLALLAVLAVLAARWLEARRGAQQRELEEAVAGRTATIARQAERLRELDGLRRDFFANVSHEFRTPLTLLLGPLEDLRAGSFGPLGDEQRKQLELAERNARRLLGLVDQLLEVAKLDAGVLELDWRFGDLAAYLRRRVEAFLSLAERRGVDLTLAAGRDPVCLWFDPLQLEKVLANLLSNALKFTPRGGAVQVSLSPAGGAAGEWVEIAVRDDGPGIPPEELERVFDRFHQVQPSAQPWPGTGIGLALARQLVELHQGEIAAANLSGHGAVFTVRLRTGAAHVPAERVQAGPAVEETKPLPLPPPRAAESEAAVAAGDPAAGAEDPRTTILVVEDNAEIRAYVRRHLEPQYRVMEAADGREGLACARRWTPDLVVTDVMMPVVDGEELFRQLRADPELSQVPVFLVTAKASPEERLEGLRQGVDEYLVKPFDPRELKVRIDNLLASRRRLLEGSHPAPRTMRISEVEVTPADEGFLRQVQAAIEARLDDPDLSVESLAADLRCDRSYLLRHLRALTGKPPSELIRTLRLQRAGQLLREGAGAVSEVAYAVGFKSVAHFSNAFQAETGERPSAFAARHRALRQELPAER